MTNKSGCVMQKKNWLLLFVIFLLTGCVKIDNSSVDIIIDNTLNDKNYVMNTVSSGYKFYLPFGVRQIVDNDNNQVFMIGDTKVYLYVDVVSFYYKNKLNYKDSENYNYYYKNIINGTKEGYIGIDKKNSDYFVKIVYNYSKVEFYVDEYNLNNVIANSLVILNNINYNDDLIEKILSYSSDLSGEVTYELDKPNNSESTFLKYLEEYTSEEEDILPDGE